MADIGVRSSKRQEVSEKSLSESTKELYKRLIRPSIKRGFFPQTTPLETGSWNNWAKTSSEIEAITGVILEDELSDVKRQVNDLGSKIESVQSELQQCKDCINTVIDELRERPVTKQTILYELDEKLEVIKPIPVIIEEYEDEVIASFAEIEVYGVGSGEAEAINNLKEEIKKMFFELANISNNKLGKLPRSWKRVLLKVVKKSGRT